ncbi:chemotaxis protein CheW [Georgenia satyanarayanai]|uniref:chemotaxis protein CheW n=1 Tax=Georgenia satyanarayanai TaxID=860221 RepID=UPI00203B1F97|nr:chemotaxis protein CheW [Georgenia satyanarayanai]MCM3661939.1 chemotaxis protein CheW [Georgenia satyanarayanai]
MSTQYVTFALGDNLYGIGVGQVQEVLPYRATASVPLAPAEVAGLVNLRGQVVLALDLRTRLGLASGGTSEPMMVVVKLGGEPVSLLVDAIGDVAEVDDAQFEAPPQTLTPELREVIRGAYKLDGRLLLALDVDAVTAA